MNLSEVVFLLFFLPTAFFCFSFSPVGKKQGVLVLFSLIFYLWGGVISLCSLLMEALVAYFGGRLIEKSRRKGRRGSLPFALATAILLLWLCYFRYGQRLLLPLWQKQTGFSFPAAMPFAVAFLTVKGVSLLLEVKRGENCPTFFQTLLYFSLFLNSGGPAVCMDEFFGVLAAPARPDVKNGCYLFAWGLAKKLILAESLSILWKDLEVLPVSSFTTVTALIFLLSYFISVCTGLSAYSDMVEGLGMMFGLPFRKNTDAPLLAVSILEFWRRFLPGIRRFFLVSLEQPLRKGDQGGLRSFFAILLSFSLMGWFFGGEWGFLFFGLTFGVAAFLESRAAFFGKLPFPLRRAATLVTAVFAFSFCRWSGGRRWVGLMKALIGCNGFAVQRDGYLLSSYWLIFLLCVLVGLKAFGKIGYRFNQDYPAMAEVIKPVAAVALLLLSVAFFGNIAESAYIFLPL